jgi:hypothetical protein
MVKNLSPEEGEIKSGEGNYHFPRTAFFIFSEAGSVPSINASMGLAPAQLIRAFYGSAANAMYPTFSGT